MSRRASKRCVVPLGPAEGWPPGVWAGLVGLGTVADLLRPLNAGQRFAFSSEDGTVFTGQVRSVGVWRSIVTPYAGYLHLVPRAIAAVASVLPLSATPSVYAVAAAVIAACAATVAARSAAALGMSMPWVCLIGAVVLILPASGFETVLSLFCVEWYCLVAFVVFIAGWLGGYRPSLWWVVPLTAVAGLTSPLLWLVLPVALPVAWVRRRPLDLALVGTVLVTTLVQGVARLHSVVTGEGSYSLAEVARFYAVRVAGGAFGGARFIRDEWDLLGTKGMAVLAAISVAAITLVYLRRTAELRLVGLFLVFTSVLFLVVEIAFRPRYFSIVNPVGFNVMDGHIELWDGRYMAVPSTCLFLATSMILDRMCRGSSRRFRRVAATVAGSALALVVLMNFPAADLHRVSLANYEQQVRTSRDACTAHHGSGELTILYGPFATSPQWRLTLSCRQAFGS